MSERHRERERQRERDRERETETETETETERQTETWVLAQLHLLRGRRAVVRLDCGARVLQPLAGHDARDDQEPREIEKEDFVWVDT